MYEKEGKGGERSLLSKSMLEELKQRSLNTERGYFKGNRYLLERQEVERSPCNCKTCGGLEGVE